MVTRTNLSQDPRATAYHATSGRVAWTNADNAGVGGVATYSIVSAAVDGPVLSDGSQPATYARKAWTTAPSSISSDVYGNGFQHTLHTSTPAMFPVTAGTDYAFASYLRPSWSGATAMVLAYFYTSGGATIGTPTKIGAAALTQSAWNRVGGTIQAPATAAYVRLWSRLNNTSSLPGVGATLDGTALLVEASSALSSYFDGAMVDTASLRYDWTGTTNASSSTSIPWVEVSLVPSGDPNPVQLVITGISNASTYVVVGSTADGSTWPVPGGSGTSTGGQVVLVDNRGALNTPITYTATWDGVTHTSAAITVVYAGRYALQSLDGRTVVAFRWRDNSLPRDYVVRSAAFDVPGRPRPATRYTTGGVGGGAIEIRTDRVGTAAMEAALLLGRPMIIRTDGGIRDLPSVEIVMFNRASTRSWGAITAPGTVSADRVWSLEYILVDDPEPGTALSAWTWDDFDDAMATRTWADFDALFAGSTWDQFDTYPWGQLT